MCWIWVPVQVLLVSPLPDIAVQFLKPYITSVVAFMYFPFGRCQTGFKDLCDILSAHLCVFPPMQRRRPFSLQQS